MESKHLSKGLFEVHFFSLMEVCSLGVVACCSNCSSIHNSGCPGYYATLGPYSDSNNFCSHTDPAVVVD